MLFSFGASPFLANILKTVKTDRSASVPLSDWSASVPLSDWSASVPLAYYFKKRATGTVALQSRLPSFSLCNRDGCAPVPLALLSLYATGTVALQSRLPSFSLCNRDGCAPVLLPSFSLCNRDGCAPVLLAFLLFMQPGRLRSSLQSAFQFRSGPSSCRGFALHISDFLCQHRPNEALLDQINHDAFSVVFG